MLRLVMIAVAAFWMIASIERLTAVLMSAIVVSHLEDPP
jgi:hypothetical protein